MMALKTRRGSLVLGVLAAALALSTVLVSPLNAHAEGADDGGEAALRDLLLPNKGWWVRGNIIGGYSAVSEELEHNLRNILCQTETEPGTGQPYCPDNDNFQGGYRAFDL